MLPEYFQIKKYDISCRLVTIEDSEFILSLRTDSKLSRFLHTTENDIEQQKKWMKEYFVRNKNGLEYYFIYSKDNIPFGLNRIYHIKDDHCEGGSWLCKKGTTPQDAIATLLIIREIIFELLNLKCEFFDVQIGNHQVKKIHLMMGAEYIGTTDNQENFRITKDNFDIGKLKFKKLLKFKD